MAKYRTNAFLEAKVAALESELIALQAEHTKAKRELIQVRDQLEVHSRVPQLSFDQLAERAKALAAQGVPCKIYHGHVIHAKTGAILL